MEYEEVGDGGRAENDIEPGPDPLVVGHKCMGNLEAVPGVGGACAICAIPPVRSTLNSVVGLVLAAILWKVRGFERYDEDERDGEGEGGELGGSGRREASSSASRLLAGYHIESLAKEER